MTGRVAAWLKSLVDGIAAAAGAAVCSQLPEFVQQYLQRLGGHRDEAFRFVQILKNQGAETSGAVIALAEERTASLARSLEVIAQASDLTRPIIFLRYLDPDVTHATLDAFQPAVPLTLAGLLYGGIGLILGLTVVNLILAPVLLIWRRARA